jgi:hypothetical protein
VAVVVAPVMVAVVVLVAYWLPQSLLIQIQLTPLL